MFPNDKPKKQKIKLPNIGKILVIASGKGGVGKSTFASNLAIALVEAGNKVGLLDADVYGPSMPRIFNIKEKGEVKNNLLIPFCKYGVKIMSMGFLVPEESALVWRGPMLTKAIHQLFKMTLWATQEEPLDYLIIDTPPGTGDIHLSIAENYEIDGAIIITTPQTLAVVDALKAIDMFKKLQINVLGIIENMSFFINSTTGHKEYIFGKSGLTDYCKNNKIQYIGDVPIDKNLADKTLINLIDDNAIKSLFRSIINNLKLSSCASKN
ncbi:Mrp/NBP35 family ATP-binding protein [Candidatus Bandiella euplotis]|uniref:Iron-sulfur cluster carrier protein n=1 Tax=Candidatus Bandiella euplotis TaxID=1664265 RepID=A0ABZ0ULH9_9RICK|nr:Mrp/NBP35 family ATP-binding protein [Candidatus Bandiella woodruffii]WPX96574.1 Mrp/NBP35 family ATP-binding protein [Candidatus Bandiella woodruffii]